jgi:MFS family permease
VGNLLVSRGKTASTAFGALRHRNFRLFLTGQIISLTGTWMQTVAQSWLVYRLTRSELLLGAAAFCTHAPVLLLGPIAGVVADRYNRRAVVVVTQILFMLQAAALAWLTLSDRVTITHVLVLAIFFGVVNAFDIPARQALMIHMTAREDLLSAISLNSATFNSARVIGPSAGGIVVASLGEGVCFALNSASYVAVIICLVALRLPLISLGEPEEVWKHLTSGIRYAWSTRQVRDTLLMCGAVTICASPMLVLAPVFADAIFHRGSAGLGFLTAALGAGAVIGTLGLARRPDTSRLAAIISASAFTMGIGLIGLAASINFAMALGVSMLVGYSVFRQNASSNTLIQTEILEEYRGRVMSLYSMMAIGLLPIGSLLGGWAAEQIGARWTVFASGMGCLAVAFWYRTNRK